VVNVEAETRLRQLAGTIEQSEALDRVADVAQHALQRVFGNRSLRRVLSGAPLGHRLHPALVAIPIGSWFAASVLDLTAGDRAAAQRLVGFGCLAAFPTAAAGAVDWLDTSGPDRRTGLVHAAVNDLALLTYVASWQSRRHGRHLRGVVLALAGSGAVAVAGWLGGHLAYSRGVGVDVHPAASDG
jgi:uncharacterized membrane protein